MYNNSTKNSEIYLLAILLALISAIGIGNYIKGLVTLVSNEFLVTEYNEVVEGEGNHYISPYCQYKRYPEKSYLYFNQYGIVKNDLNDGTDFIPIKYDMIVNFSFPESTAGRREMHTNYSYLGFESEVRAELSEVISSFFSGYSYTQVNEIRSNRDKFEAIIVTKLNEDREIGDLDITITSCKIYNILTLE